MKKFVKRVLGIGLAVFVFAFVAGLCYGKRCPSIVNPEEKDVLLLIDYGDKEVAYDYDTTASTLGLLLRSIQRDINLQGETSTYGFYVESIGSKVNGDDGKYWMVYDGDQISNVGVDSIALVDEGYYQLVFETPQW